ncbi:MAG: hypothetical protein JWM47_3873 [Acidimicrobiales bacterium]|nr:hypothetical protein [Acidimicrobiales bacterium]
MVQLSVDHCEMTQALAVVPKGSHFGEPAS